MFINIMILDGYHELDNEYAAKYFIYIHKAHLL